MRRNARSRPTRSLVLMLQRQSASFKKRPEFARLEEMLRDSSELRTVRLSSTAMKLLDEPRLRPRNLDNFYATYRVKKHPFFSLFLNVKWLMVEQRKKKKSDKHARIQNIMAAYPPDVLRLMRYLAAAEGRLRPAAPLCMKVLIPGTLKRARELVLYYRAQWTALTRRAIGIIEGGYRSLALRDAEELIARSILDCLPHPRTGKTPSEAEAKAKFRSLSKACHPDSGGDAAAFRLLAWARDMLSGETRRAKRERSPRNG